MIVEGWGKSELLRTTEDGRFSSFLALKILDLGCDDRLCTRRLDMGGRHWATT